MLDESKLKRTTIPEIIVLAEIFCFTSQSIYKLLGALHPVLAEYNLPPICDTSGIKSLYIEG